MRDVWKFIVRVSVIVDNRVICQQARPVCTSLQDARSMLRLLECRALSDFFSSVPARCLFDSPLPYKLRRSIFDVSANDYVSVTVDDYAF